jgi:LCP family protein required for cell wall assembly
MGAESLWEPHTPARSQPSPPPPQPPPAAETHRRWFRRPVAVTGIALSLLLTAGLGLMYLASERLGNNVTRVQNAFGGLDEAARPPVTGALTFLLVGTDSRSETTAPGIYANGTNSDAEVVMVAHVAADLKSATVVSIPRDSWVDIPGHAAGRVSGAYAAGGPSLLIKTVEHITSLRIDHFAVIDFAGFRSMVEAVGGIEIDVPTPVAGFTRGVTHMDGGQALSYVRDRTGVATGDRARRQQNALRAILEKAAKSDIFVDPVRLYDFLDAASHAVGVDDTLSNGGMRALALKLSDLPPAEILFLRAPVAGIGHDAAGLVVNLDRGRSAELWMAVQQGGAAAYAQQNARDALGPVTR